MILERIWPPLLVAAVFALPAVVLAPAKQALLVPVYVPIAKPELPIAVEPPKPMGYDDIEGCLLEYSERGYGDAKLYLRTSISRGGHVFGIVTYQSPDHTSLRICIEESLRRTTHEPRAEVSTYDVIVTWASASLPGPRRLAMEVRVLHGWHRVPAERGMHVSSFYEDNMSDFENALPMVAKCFDGDESVSFSMELGETVTATGGTGLPHVRACVIGAFLRDYKTDRARTIQVTASKDWFSMQQHETDAPDIQWHRAR